MEDRGFTCCTCVLYIGWNLLPWALKTQAILELNSPALKPSVSTWALLIAYLAVKAQRYDVLFKDVSSRLRVFVVAEIHDDQALMKKETPSTLFSDGVSDNIDLFCRHIGRPGAARGKNKFFALCFL